MGVFMTNLKNFEPPKFSFEEIAEVKEYQAKNRPIEVAKLKGLEVTQYCYGDGRVVELEEDGSIFDVYRMPNNELEQIMSRHEQINAVLNPMISSMKKWREPGIK
jgi:hypothetical protein